MVQMVQVILEEINLTAFVRQLNKLREFSGLPLSISSMITEMCIWILARKRKQQGTS